MGLFAIQPSTGKIYAMVPGIELIADQYMLQITATDNHMPVPGSSVANLTLNIVDTVLLTGKSIAIEGESIRLEFRRYTANPDIPIDVPFEIVNSTSAPGWNLPISNAFADAADFDPSADRTTLFTANPRVVQFGSSTGTSVILTLRATPDGTGEGVEGFQVKLQPPDNPTAYDLYDDQRWQEDLPNDGQKQLGGGSAVTCFVVDGIKLFAKDNQIIQLFDAGEIEPTNPGVCFNDVNQGGIGSCWLTAAIAAFVARPGGRARLQTIMRQTGPLDFEVDLVRSGTLETVSITLNLSRGYSSTELSGDFDPTDNYKAEVWPLVLEQAIGKLLALGSNDINAIYAAIDNGNSGAVMEYLGGTNVDTLTPAIADVPSTIRQALAANKAVVLSTGSGGGTPSPSTITDPATGDQVTITMTSTHAYAVVEAANLNLNGVIVPAIRLVDVRQRFIHSFWIRESDFVSLLGAFKIDTVDLP